MPLLKELFSTDVGLMSAVGLTMMLGIGGYLVWFFLKHIRDDVDGSPKP
jgi:hypothetical protein